MKKLMALLLSFVIIVMLASCSLENKTGENEVSNEKITANKVKINEIIEEQENEESSRKRSELLPKTYKLPEKKLYVDIPNYSDIESGYTELFKDGDSKCITITCLRDETFASGKEAFDSLYAKFKNNIKSWCRINGETFTLEENVKVNEIETLRVTGTVKLGVLNYYDCYLYGYGFIFEGVPCAIIGVVSDLDQPQEEIDELTAIVDAMMESVRNEQ